MRIDIYNDPKEVRLKRIKEQIGNRDYEGTTQVLTSDLVELIPTLSVFDNIRDWADKRALLKPEGVNRQMVKLMEELGETSRAILKDDKPEISDGLGDIVVVLTILSAQLGYNLEDCVNQSYEVIKNRTGKTVNGVFVKDV